MEKITIKIGVVSDVVCPWCYIGKKRLEKAMDLSADRFDFDVEYFPFELNPHMPEEGIDYREYICRKFGSEAKSLALNNPIRQIAAQEGLSFNMDLQKTSPNTRNAHRIILFARKKDKQMEMMEAFHKAYFTEGTDLSNIENLIGISARAGLDGEQIDQLLHSNQGKMEIERAEKELHDLGITAVPLFIFNDKFAISGAQSVEAFIKAFDEVTLVSGDVSDPVER